jgi:hypothetical protein
MTWKRWYGFVLLGTGIAFIPISIESYTQAIGIPNLMMATLTETVYFTFVYIGLTSKGGLWEPGA